MLTQIVLTAAVLLGVAPADQQLALTNVRTLHGPLGVARGDSRIAPGDTLSLAFDVDGLAADSEGKVHYGIGLEVADSADKVHFKQEPRDLEATRILGGTYLPAFAAVDIGLDQAPGKYTLKITVTDRTARKTAALNHEFEVLPRGFHLVRLTLAGDPEGRVSLPLVAEGQTVWVHFLAVDVTRDAKTGKGALALEMQAYDEHNQPVRAKPVTGTVEQDLTEQATALPVSFPVPANRAGKYRIEIKATDKHGNQTTTLVFGVPVLKPQ